jgi:hypothetical protein
MREHLMTSRIELYHLVSVKNNKKSNLWETPNDLTTLMKSCAEKVIDVVVNELRKEVCKLMLARLLARAL